MLFKSINRIIFLTLDLIAFVSLYYICVFIGDNFIIEDYSFKTFILISSISLSKVLINYLFKVYNHLWKYGNKRDFLVLILFNAILNSIIIITCCLLLLCDIHTLSINIFIFSSLFEIVYLYISRRIYGEFKRSYKNNIKQINHKKTMIIGAGSAGVGILEELSKNNPSKLDVIGFIDDDTKKIGALVSNIKVYGPISELNTFTKRHKVTDLIIAIPSASDDRITEITRSINYKDMNVMIVPSFTKLLENNFAKTLRKVSIDDLLGRKSIDLDKGGISEFIKDRVVLVTGGGGSIGSEICRQILDYNPKQLIIFDIYENSVYSLYTELDMKYRNLEINTMRYVPLIGSVRDIDRLDEVFSEYKPDIVFHAAAHKHVPLMEQSPKESVKNNIIGTYNVASMCDKYNVKKMVLISTDKAVNPTNVMGASKRVCEMVVEAWNNYSKTTKYSMVRFGNVLGSNGSVIPLFEKQLKAGGPVTVTHPDINRFFMTIPEACSLVIQSGVYAKGGEKFILDMGEPVKIIDLARKMIQLSGLRPDIDIKIEITGLRPGEKLYEELLLDTKTATKTENDKIYIEKESKVYTIENINNIIDDIVNILNSNTDDKNKKFLTYLAELEDERR